MSHFTEAQLAEAAALDEFRNKPIEVSLQVWAAIGAKFKRQGRRGISQSQNIARGVQELVNQGLTLEEVLTTEQYQFADTSWRLCDFVSATAAAEEEAFIGDEEPNSSSVIGREPASSSIVPVAEDPESEEEVVIEDEEPSSSSVIGREPASSSSLAPEPPAAKRRRLPRDVPQPLRPTWVFAAESVRFFTFNPGTDLWEQVDRLQRPTATRDGVLAIDFHQVLDRTSSSEPVEGAAVPNINLDILSQAKRQAPNLHTYCISQLRSDRTLGNLLQSFRRSVGIERVIDHLIITPDKTGHSGKNAFITQVCNPATALLLDDHVGTIIEADNLGIQTVHICYPGSRHWAPGHIEYRAGLAECLPTILAKRESASLRQRVVDR